MCQVPGLDWLLGKHEHVVPSLDRIHALAVDHQVRNGIVGKQQD
jgi:hypothetical protein